VFAEELDSCGRDLVEKLRPVVDDVDRKTRHRSSQAAISVRDRHQPCVGMWEAHLICSGSGCYAEVEIAIDSLDELDGLCCDCGYGFVLLRVFELLPA
jgi:hypothetical protein